MPGGHFSQGRQARLYVRWPFFSGANFEENCHETV
jgi:hypothetical protein